MFGIIISKHTPYLSKGRGLIDTTFSMPVFSPLFFVNGVYTLFNSIYVAYLQYLNHYDFLNSPRILISKEKQ